MEGFVPAGKGGLRPRSAHVDPDGAGSHRHLAGHVIVCGSDHLGIRTVEELQLRDERVVLVAPAGESTTDLDRLTDVDLVRGDQRHDRVLPTAGIDTAEAIVLTADDDLANVHAALAAHDLNPDIRIVIRLFDAELGAHLPNLFPNAVALSSSALAAPGFVSAALDGEGGGTFDFGGRTFTVRHTGEEPASTSDERPALRQSSMSCRSHASCPTGRWSCCLTPRRTRRASSAWTRARAGVLESPHRGDEPIGSSGGSGSCPAACAGD